MIKLTKIIRSIDQFGHPVRLHLDEQGEPHKTYFGGFLTIIYFMFTFAYFGFCLQKMITHIQDINIALTSAIDLGQFGNVTYNQTGMLFFTLISGKNIDSSFQNLSRYLDIYYQECDIDLDIQPQCLSTKKVPARWCSLNDFINLDPNKSDQAKNIYDNLINQKLVCPDFENYDSFILNNDGTDLKFTRIDLVYDKCNNQTSGGSCRSAEELNEFLEDFQVRVMRLYKQIDFTIYDNEPTSLVLENTDLAYPIISLVKQYEQAVLYYLNFVNYATSDDLFQFGQITLQGSYFDVIKRSSHLKPIIQGQAAHLYRVSLLLAPTSQTLQRTSYTMFAIFGEIGGITSVLIVFIALIAEPVTNQSVFFKFLSRLFLARTKNQHIFIEKEHKELKNQRSLTKYRKNKGKYNESISQEIMSHKRIKMRFKDQVIMFIIKMQCYFRGCFSNLKFYQNLEKKGTSRIDREMNIVKIIKNIRYFKMVIDSLIMTPDLKFELKHSISNIIDVDCSQSEDKIVQDNLKLYTVVNQQKEKRKSYAFNESKYFQNARQKIQEQIVQYWKAKNPENFVEISINEDKDEEVIECNSNQTPFSQASQIKRPKFKQFQTQQIIKNNDQHSEIFNFEQKSNSKQLEIIRMKQRHDSIFSTPIDIRPQKNQYQIKSPKLKQ